MNNNNTAIAYLCAECNDFSEFSMNIFSFSGNRKKVFECGCKKSKITIVKNTNKSFKIDIKCPICNENHSYVIGQNQFWSGDVYSFPCSFYDANILFIGSKNKLESAISDYIDEEIALSEGSPFLPDYQTLSKVTNLIKFIEENPKVIKICNCDSTYTTAYNPNELFIICDNCHYCFSLKYEKIEDYLNEINS